LCTDVRASRRAHIILLLADGFAYRDIHAIAYASFDFIAEAVRRFRSGAIDALAEHPVRPEEPAWIEDVLGWILEKTPEDFGYFRSRWSCATLAEVLAWEKKIHVSAETVRRALHRFNFVWRRPRPVLGRTDPEYDSKLPEIHDLLEALPTDETAVCEDEVDVNLNPKIGSCWMPRGEQAEVVTPGNNEKRHVAGSLHWRTGTLLVSSPGTRRNTQLFLKHLDDLRRALRGYRKIHIICDNAPFHISAPVRQYLAKWQHRIQLHFLPQYAPQTNPIERVWWHFHETITRNHRCHTLAELLQQSYDWFRHSGSFYFEMKTVFPMAA